MRIFRKRKITLADEWAEKRTTIQAMEPYAEYDQLVDDLISRTRGMAHCDQWVLHTPGLCEYCDRYPQLQEARQRLGINFTGESDPSLLRCPAERMRPLKVVERWHGNIPMTPEQKLRDEEYWREFDAHMRAAFPDVDFDS